MSEVYIGRQPIVDAEKRIIGFELLFRSPDSESAKVMRNSTATSAVVSRALTDVALDTICGDKLTFINVDSEFLETDLVTLLPKERVVFEILETVKFTPKLVKRIRDLREVGYRFALDDYTQIEPPQIISSGISYVKVDVLQISDKLAINEIIKSLKKYPVHIIAEKVETHELFNFLKNKGIVLFQGYFFSKPDTLRSRTLLPEKAKIIELIRDLEADLDTKIIYSKIKGSAEISFKVLKLVNSPAFYRGQQITSLWQALLALGRKNIKKLLLLILISNDLKSMGSDPMLERAIFRACLMESLSEKIEGEERLSERAYLCGLISVLDAVLGSPLSFIVQELRLNDELKEALIKKKGKLGKLLQIVLKLEENSEEDLKTLLGSLNLGLRGLFQSEEKANKESTGFLST